MPSSSFPIPGSTPRPIPKESYQPDSPLTSELSFRLAENDSSLFHLITGVRPAANGVAPSDEYGHQHRGGDSGAPIARIIPGCPQSVTALWTATVAAGGSTPLNSDSSIFTPDANELMFWVPHGINKLNLYINASISYADAGGTGKLRCRVGSTDYSVSLTAGGVTWTRLWSGETNGPQTHSTNIKVVPDSWTGMQMFFYNDFGAASTINIYGWFLKEATDIT